MDITKFEVFLQVVECGSLAKAAEALQYTASGVNRMMSALEAEMGFALLYRSHTGVRPTPNGERLLPVFREIVRWNEQARQMRDEIKGLVRGNLTIGAIYSVSACWLPSIIKAFLGDYPNIHLRIMEGNKDSLDQWLREKRVDCCFLTQKPDGCQWVPLRDDPLMAWLPQDHPCAKLRAFPLSRFQDEAYIKTYPENDTQIDRMLQDEGIVPNIRFTTMDNYATYAMVEAGLGISINNQLMAKNWAGQVAVLPLDPPKHISLGVCFPSLETASPAALRFIDYAKMII